MIRPIATCLAVFAMGTLGARAAPPKIALVRVTDIYRELPSTKKRIPEFEAERSAIMKDRRADEVRKLVEELQGLQAKIQKAKADNPNDPTLVAQVKEYNEKASAMDTLQHDFESFKSGRDLEINRKVVTFMRASFEKINAEVRTVAAAKGYDWVIDSSGNSNTGVPVLLYSKNAPDISADVIAALSKESEAGETAEAGPAPAPVPSPATTAPQPPTSTKPPVR